VALKLARLDVSNILVMGESGTGKGLLAKFIHQSSARKKKPFIQINCAALPETLLEAELFGYEKGAFTGADQQGKIGLFEMAQGGTIFLDEIGDLPFGVQAKLLKCLDDHEIRHLGGLKPIKIDCIVIAATNRDLETLVQEAKFREDLYFRLSAFNIRIPPLRERPEDIVEIANHFLEKYNRQYQADRRFSSLAVKDLQRYPFPGNVREIKNIVRNAVVMSEVDLLDHILPDRSVQSVADAPAQRDMPKVSGKRTLTDQLEASEKEIFKKAAQNCRTTREIASYLGISQPSVVRRLKKYGLSPSKEVIS
jgi:transcriptional regulator with PAS, ATPase and Fis domain